MAMRTILEGYGKPTHSEQVTKLILKSLGVKHDAWNAIAFQALEPFPKE
jgi:hypothetical protein